MDQVALYQDNNSIETPTNDTPQNYTILISKLEQLALGLNTDLENLANLGKKHLAITFNEDVNSGEDISGEYITATGVHRAAGSSDTPGVSRMPNGMTEAEYNRVVSDIWIGVILTLLIVTVIFFICSCFLYHKFQQWKNSYRTSDALDPTDVIRRYDLDVESLPSYTIVSGLPTYDDALEEFRKAGIILKPHVPVVKIFDRGAKESAAPPPSPGDDLPEYTPPTDNASACICGAVGALQQNQVIELNPEHLQMLSQKRLSLQISFNGQPAAIRRNSRSRVDLCTQVSRNNLWRAAMDQMPEIHRSSSLTFDNERSVIEHRLRKLGHHRGSIS